MSAEESEAAKSDQSAPFRETDGGATKLGYGEGGVPLFVAIAWVIFLCAYVVYMVIYALPDLSAWGLP